MPMVYGKGCRIMTTENLFGIILKMFHVKHFCKVEAQTLAFYFRFTVRRPD